MGSSPRFHPKRGTLVSFELNNEQLNQQLWQNDQQRPATAHDRLNGIVDAFQLKQDFLYLVQLSENIPKRIQRPKRLLPRLCRVSLQSIQPFAQATSLTMQTRSSSSSFSLFKGPARSSRSRNNSTCSSKEPQTPSPRRSSRSSGSPSGYSRCPRCDELFTGNYHKTNLTRHMKSVHRKGSALPCPLQSCSETFTRSDNLKTHVRNLHP